MPKDNIQRAIDKGQGGDSDDYFEIRYEGYGPGGVALIVEALTDNRNRAASNVRAAFTKNGGTLGETGSVGFMFDRVGEIVYPASAGTEDEVMEAAIEAGAEDVVTELDDDAGNGAGGGGTHTIHCAFEEMSEVAAALEAKLGEPESVNPTWRPQNVTEVDEEKAGTLLKLLDTLEDEDDVQNVYGNYEIPDDVMERVSGA